MKPLEYFAIKGQVVSTHPVSVIKLEMTPNASITDGLFLQIHDAAASPATGAVPVKVWPAAECGYKEFKRGELVLSVGCFICLSTTAATKTGANGVSDLMNILQVELSDPERPTGTTVVGDLTSPVTGLQVWADAAGPKKLIHLEVDGTNLTATCYIQLFAVDSPADGIAPLMTLRKITAGQVLTGASGLYFGEKGRDVQSVDSTGGLHDGCTIKISTTPSVLTTTGDTARIQAEYHA
jgi:hypothetical protein